MNEFLMERCYVGGEWTQSPETIEVTNPFDNSVIGTVPAVTANDTAAAIARAKEAQDAWAAVPAPQRGEYLRKLHALVIEHLEPLAQIVTMESGKPIKEARGEVRYSASFLSWFAGEAERIYGETVPAKRANRSITVMPEPVGPCGVITPWNFPSAMLARKVAPALAAGCTVVCKPAELTPFSGLAWGKLCEMAGIPHGVVNIVTGDPVSLGRVLTGSPEIRKLTFTGSTRVGKILMADSAQTMKRVSFELGGNAPFIVCQDAAMDTAIDCAMAAKFRNAGQTCVAGNRYFVHESIHDVFVERISAAVGALVVGNGASEDTDIGPLISQAAADKVSGLVNAALDAGATLVQGDKPTGAQLMTPVVVTGVNGDMAMANEEIFGPVIAVHKYGSDDEVIARANDTQYGLAAYVCTQDRLRMRRFAGSLEYGMVGFNTGLMSTAEAPFGGYKQSGLGREGGRAGIEEYLERKYVCIDD